MSKTFCVDLDQINLDMHLFEYALCIAHAVAYGNTPSSNTVVEFKEMYEESERRRSALRIRTENAVRS